MKNRFATYQNRPKKFEISLFWENENFPRDSLGKFSELHLALFQKYNGVTMSLMAYDMRYAKLNFLVTRVS